MYTIPPMPKSVKCPKCGNLTEFSTSNPYRPFCSQRCQLIDLGKWADEKYTIPTPDEAGKKEDLEAAAKEDQPDSDLPGRDEG